MMRFLLTLIFIGLAWQAQAQVQKEQFNLQWNLQTDISFRSEEHLYVPGFEDNFKFDAKKGLVLFYYRKKLSQNLMDVQISSIQTRPVQASYLKNLNTSNIPAEPHLKWSVSQARSTHYLTVQMNPIIQTNGRYRLITDFSLTYQTTRQQVYQNSSSTPGIMNSIFSSGNFFKFYVEKSGAYRLTYDFLENLGMDVSSINPRRIKIYGHGGGMLPLRNSLTQHYDPPEQAIRVLGGQDGNFDPGDAILFYGKAVDDEWNKESKTNLNLYANRSYYYITADGAIGKRMVPHNPISANATTTITSYDAYQYYETDQYSVGKVGRRWVSDRLSVEPVKTYKFTFPNLVPTQPVHIEVYGVGASESSTSMDIAVNGNYQTTFDFSSLGEFDFGDPEKYESNIDINQDEIRVRITYNNQGNPASLGFIDYINVSAERQLIAGNSQFEFTKKETATQSGVGKYVIQNASQVKAVWDVTDRGNIIIYKNQNQANVFSFKANLGEQRKYVGVVNNDYLTPSLPNRTQVQNINLKGTVFETPQGTIESPDYLIITSELLVAQAQRLAQYRSTTDGLNTKVVLVDDIYQEFNSGKQDISAIRNFIKYVYDNAPNPNNRLQYVCLFGDASVDYKNRLSQNTNIVPIFESLTSFTLGSSSAATDDFYGSMDPNEGRLNGDDALDIAVGRILAHTPQKAQLLVDKIFSYESRESYGSWRNNFLLISDDADDSGDADLQEQLDDLGQEISEEQHFVNVKKIHSDAYQQVSSAGGFRYPEVNKDINQAVEVGALVVNYFGHGGPDGLAAERIVTRGDIKSWDNENKLNVFVTVTCDFTKFDNPLRVSPGELNLRNPDGGSVAMVSTTRTIGIGTGADFNTALAPYLFDYQNRNISIAEAVRLAKNQEGDVHEVSFLGDPALKLAIPEPKVKLTKINGTPIAQSNDTLKALEKVSLSGKIVAPNGNLLSNYSGVLSTSIFDKRIERETLGNDGTTDNNGDLLTMEFTTLGEILFRGKASVNQGKFKFNFILPKDIQIPVGTGRISLYAKRENILQDQHGVNTEIKIGGVNKNAPEDNIGPEIELYMNDESFVSGGITNSSPYLLAKLSDKHGINTASGIGHDLVAILDGDETNPIVVNDYYETKVNDFTKGNVYYQLQNLEKGLHTLKFTAWDVYNNSSTAKIQFRVTGDKGLKITRVLNYPNPFSTYTEFWFRHNRPMEPLKVQVQVFTITGKLVWNHQQLVNTKGFLCREITWNGTDNYGQRIGKGVYLYKLTVKSTVTHDKVEKIEKLVIL